MKRGGYLARRTPMRRISVKRRREESKRAAACREVDERDGLGCYAFLVINKRRATAIAHGWPITCAGTVDHHEVIPRSAWPGGHLIASNIRRVCRRHHDWIDAHEITAATLGLHGYSHQRGRCQNEGCGELLGRCRCEAT
jgi:hypothetical protein